MVLANKQLQCYYIFSQTASYHVYCTCVELFSHRSSPIHSLDDSSCNIWMEPRCSKIIRQSSTQNIQGKTKIDFKSSLLPNVFNCLVCQTCIQQTSKTKKKWFHYRSRARNRRIWSWGWWRFRQSESRDFSDHFEMARFTNWERLSL